MRNSAPSNRPSLCLFECTHPAVGIDTKFSLLEFVGETIKREVTKGKKKYAQISLSCRITFPCRIPAYYRSL